MVKTVKIVDGKGFKTINADDLTEGDEIYVEPKTKEPTVAEIKAKLTELEIDFDDKAKKPELLELLPEDAFDYGDDD